MMMEKNPLSLQCLVLALEEGFFFVNVKCHSYLDIWVLFTFLSFFNLSFYFSYMPTEYSYN